MVHRLADAPLTGRCFDELVVRENDNVILNLCPINLVDLIVMQTEMHSVVVRDAQHPLLLS